MGDVNSAVDQDGEISPSDRRLTIDELENHRSLDTGVWIAIAGNVYDVSTFLPQHPGGDAILLDAAGTDVTEDFFDLHSDEAEKLLPAYHIGKLSSSIESPTMPPPKPQEACTPFLQRDSWKKVVLWHDDSQEFDLPVGKHILLRLKSPISGEQVVRAYTPIAARCESVEVDLVVKIYHDTDTRKGGKMTTTIDLAPIGSLLELKGPVGKFEYSGQGNCDISGRKCHAKRFIMISAGSGITPMIQILRAIAEDANDTTECLLLNGNRCEEDILCKDQLDIFERGEMSQFRVIHTLSSPSDGWAGRRGRIGQELLEAEVGPPTPGGAEMVLLCGPPAMEATIRDVLSKNGWKEGDIVRF
ncbi:Nitrate reductase [NADPH] [Fusarium oxysporum f. sp. cubense race 1]|uniref:Nitrate reductase [NADPH] n=1 Tax=Fusarium oxysporum f. sp. cubense (strain race 1) TaxID=1229664 RepID=N4TWY5_FUSC1|nr:Nitrate reductase [NADPH] [Fusarium oxysporum f. sp. cubense race 1]